MAKTIRFLLATLLLGAGLAGAAEIKVMTSGGFAEAANVLTPPYEKRTGDKVVMTATDRRWATRRIRFRRGSRAASPPTS